MNSKLIIGALSLATIFTSGLAIKAHADVQISASSVPVYRVYNTNSGEHFYTTSSFEKDSLVGTGWDYEGIGWQSATAGKAIYRLYNPNAKGGDHYYTQSSYEASSLVQKGWKQDNQGKPVFYSGGNINNYVAYNPNAQSGAHNYTTSQFEQNNLLKIGWKYGKVAWSVAGVGQSVTPMNLGQLAKGDYSSIQGTWKNSRGETLTFKGNKVTGAVDITGEGVKEATLIRSSETFFAGIHNNTLAIDSIPATKLDTRYFVFAPKNVSPSDYKDTTDKTRDRLYITTNGGNGVFENPEFAYYRIK